MPPSLPPEDWLERSSVQDLTFLEELARLFGSRPRQNEPLAPNTTLQLGGPAEVWLAVENVSELVAAATLAWQHGVPVFILGGGANLLIKDGGIPGLVIENRANQVEFLVAAGLAAGSEAVKIVAESGAVLPNLARRCAQRGLSGLEWAVGVPGTLGGAVVNNAGAYGSDMAHNLSRAELLASTGERRWQPVEWFKYGYRMSKLKNPGSKGQKKSEWIVLRAELSLRPAPVSEIKARQAGFNQRRKASQPPGATLGSMFKNPPGDYAGRLIEAAGLKGYRLGQAQISPVHANFFQNLGGATAAEMLQLIELARTTVEARFGLKLELEIEVVGQDSHGQ